MLSYILFIFKTVFNKKSIYIYSGILFLFFILITYILPYALKMHINQLFSLSLILALLIFLIAIFSILVSTTIFRQGIDDGSELLIITKQLSRKEIIIAKFIALLVILLLTSLIAFIVPVFLKFSKYGTSTPLDYCCGYFLATFIVSIFFGSISILFCLIMKKNHATFTTLGIASLLMFLNAINYLTVSNTGGYISKYSYGLDSVSIKQKDGTILTGDILAQYNLPYISQKHTNIIDNLQKEALKETKVKTYTYMDPFFQLSNLFSLGNFYHSQNCSSWNNLNVSDQLFVDSSWTNLYLTFTPIQDVDLEKEFSITYENKLYSLTYLYHDVFTIKNYSREIDLDIKEPMLYDRNIFLLPILEYENNLVKENISLQFFDMTKQDDVKKIVDIFFSPKNPNSIFTLFNNYQSYLKKVNNASAENHYNFQSFLNTYLYLGFSIIFENIVNSKPITLKYDNISYSIPSNILDNIKSYFSNNIVLWKEYFNIQEVTQFLNKKYLFQTMLLLFLNRYNISIFQEYFLKYLPNRFDFDSIQDPDIQKNILDFFDLNSYKYTNFFQLLNRNVANNESELITKYLSTFNNGYIYNLLSSWNTGKTYISSNSYQIVNSQAINTFSKSKINYYLNIYGLVFSWLGFSLLLFIVAGLIYSKKDIK